MLEIVLIILLGVIYAVPFKGIIKLSEKEKRFMDSYKSFDTFVDYDEVDADSLIGGENTTGAGFGVQGGSGDSVSDIPTMVSLDSLNEGFEDIDINSMGR